MYIYIYIKNDRNQETSENGPPFSSITNCLSLVKKITDKEDMDIPKETTFFQDIFTETEENLPWNLRILQAKKAVSQPGF